MTMTEAQALLATMTPPRPAMAEWLTSLTSPRPKYIADHFGARQWADHIEGLAADQPAEAKALARALATVASYDAIAAKKIKVQYEYANTGTPYGCGKVADWQTTTYHLAQVAERMTALAGS